MLREVGNVHQPDAHRRRRWLCDDYFDIFVWENGAGRMVEMQLCYDKAVRERVLRWREAAGFTHHRIDSGDESTFKNRSPILVADDASPPDAALEKFDARAANIEPRLRNFIRARLTEYGEKLDKSVSGG